MSKINFILISLLGVSFFITMTMFHIRDLRQSLRASPDEGIATNFEGVGNAKLRKSVLNREHSQSEKDRNSFLKKSAQLEFDYSTLLLKNENLRSPTGSWSQANATYTRLEAEYNAWLPGYQAPNPRHQDFCMKTLTQHVAGSSQFGQDVFIFFNVFKYWPMRGRKGFYIDSGTNDPVVDNNTFFFDVCLGWSGLCVEPNEEYHHRITSERSCTLIPECISDQETSVSFHNNGGVGKVMDGVGSTKCTTLQKMLKRSVNPNQEVIDLWSLDVEGYEMTVLNAVDLKRNPVRALLVEDFWVNTRDLDYLLYMNGYKKFQPLAIDSLYTPKDFEEPIYIWYPANFFNDIEFHQKWRKSPDLPFPLVCS